MHELSLCKSILEIVQQQALEKKYNRVKKIFLEFGQLAAVDKEALNFSFSVVTQGTVAENAELAFIDIPGQALCETCNKEVPLQQYYDACPLCGGHSLKVIAGEELQIKSMVVE